MSHDVSPLEQVPTTFEPSDQRSDEPSFAIVVAAVLGVSLAAIILLALMMAGI